MQFEVGERYSAEEIQQRLEVGNAGGIRVSLDSKRQVRRVVLLTAAPTAKIERENPYHDRIEGDVLVYAAAGLHGDQTLGGVNKRLASQPNTQFPIYGFRLNENRRKAGVRRWEFLGLLQFLRLYPDNQIDRTGNLRKAWLFELRVCSEFTKVRLSEERALTNAAFAEFKFDAEREARAEASALVEPASDVRANAEAVERVRAKIFALDPRSFELLVQSALERTGFVEVSITRYTADNGVDVNARVSAVHWPIAGIRVQVQAKRWLHTVGRREVAELRGSLEPFAQGAVVTTSCFSRAAHAEAKANGRQPIVLVDGYQFALTAKSYGLISA
jgi:restriction endonuclease Mrr